MRLFTAIDLPAALLERVEGTLATLRPLAAISWSRPENLHITTKFLGEWPEERLEELKKTLEPLAARSPVAITIRGLGWFPDSRRPRGLYAGVDGGTALPDLARATDAALAAIGVAAELKAYSPHLTLARVKDRFPIERLRPAAEKHEAELFGRFEAERFWLYRSQLTPRGSVYTKLAAFSFCS